jgi:monofunctional biosynthetic peptidoglycan transglycosylase
MPKPRKSLGRRAASILAKLTLSLVAGSTLLVFAMRWLPVPVSGVMIEKTLTERADDRYRLHYRWVPAADISPHMKVAVIAAEDQRFPDHFGFDFGAMADAFADYREGDRLRGASTISQQTAKNVFLWTGRSVIRKGLEAYLTTLIELMWPKRRILEAYLNVAEFGHGVFGVEAAAQTYFQKPAATLTAAESALLAAVLPNPLLLRVDRPSEYVLARRDWILRQMIRLGGPDYLRQLG